MLAVLVAAGVLGAPGSLQKRPKMHGPARNRSVEAGGCNLHAPPYQEDQAIRLRPASRSKDLTSASPYSALVTKVTIRRAYDWQKITFHIQS